MRQMRPVLVMVILIITSIFLTSCAGLFAKGNKRITEEKYTSQIKAGESDKAKVKELFGEPDSIEKVPAEGETWSYSYKPADSTCTLCGISFTKRGKLHSLIITFREDDIVKDIDKK